MCQYRFLYNRRVKKILYSACNLQRAAEVCKELQLECSVNAALECTKEQLRVQDNETSREICIGEAQN